MTHSARRRAEACFRLARSTSFPAERETAIARGKSIVATAGLDIADFDVPGQPRAAPRPAAGRRPHFVVHDEFFSELNEALQRMATAFAAASARAGVQPGETIHDAQRRNFEEAVRAAAARDRRRGAGV